MSLCWSCGEEITEKNFSKEHIIPNALCGTRKPENLLCRKCNSEFDHLDRVLSNDLDFILANVKCKRDRGVSKAIILRSPDGTEYLYKDGIPRLKSPKFPDKPEKMIIDGKKEDVYRITARDWEEVKILRKGLEKRHPGKVVKPVEIEEKNEYLGPLPFNSSILSYESYRGVAKIAVNFYIWSGGRIDYVNQGIMDYIKGLNEEKLVALFYPNIEINKSSCDVKHKLYLKGLEKDKILYCYIELFDALNFIVLLNDNYQGETFEGLYELNVETKNESIEDFGLNLNVNEITEILKSELPLDDLKNHIGRIERLISSKRAGEAVIDIIKTEFQENLDTDFRSVWENIKLKLDEFPNWDVWVSNICNKVEVWEQKGSKCSCGSSKYLLVLTPTPMPLTRKIAALHLLIICKSCEKPLSLEFLTSY